MKAAWPALVLLVSLVHASHFRGGVIMTRPKPDGQHREMLISYRISWRRSASAGGSCNDKSISDGTLYGEGDLRCLTGCSGTISSMKYHCTDFSTEEDWSYGQREVTYTFPKTTQTSFKIGFTGSAWISPFNGPWYLATVVNVKPRQDTGRVNSSPRAVTTPVVRLQSGCQHTVSIAVSDPDGDDVKCRFATSDCGSICNSWPGATLDQEKCVIHYDATSANPGYRAAALVLEDYPKYNTTVPLSSVSLQFLVLVYSSEGPCSTKPKFTNPTFEQGSCTAIPPGETLNTVLLATTGGVRLKLTEIQTVSPPGLRKSSLGYDDNRGYVNVSWTPTTEQQNQTSLLCFTATNTAGASSDQRCVSFAVGSYPPKIIDHQPRNTKVDLRNNIFIITFDQKIARPNKPAYIIFYEVKPYQRFVKGVDTSRPGAVTFMDDNTLRFNQSFPLAEKREHFITIDKGIVKGVTSCGPENEAVTDKNFWRFMTRDHTPPTIRITAPNRPRTRENITIEWQINEEVTLTSASLGFNGSFTDQGHPNGIWHATGLKEGRYNFTITAIDLEGNIGKYSYIFIVDLTPPKIFFRAPFSSNVTNLKQFNIRLLCDETGCTFLCKFSDGQNIESLSYIQCRHTFRVTNQANEESYTLMVQATDVAGNVAEDQFKWTVDLEPPTIIPLPDVYATCEATDFSPDARGKPEVLDNLDLTPKVTYSESKTSCDIERRWTARDRAGNSAEIRQNIYLSFKFDISYLPIVDLQCDSTKPSPMIPPNTAHVSNPCGRPITLTYTDDITAPTCPGTVTRTWTAIDGCSRNEPEVKAEQVIRLYDQCPITACGRGKNPPHGICSQGLCKCSKPWYGENCETLIREPIISDISDKMVKEGERFSFNPTLIEGTPPITWFQESELKYMKIDPKTGELNLLRAIAGTHIVKVKAQNNVGTYEVVFQIIVEKGYDVFLYPLVQSQFGKALPVHLKGYVAYHERNVIGGLLNYVVPVEVDIFHNNIRRTLRVFTDDVSGFSTFFHPLPHEYGIFNASARHTSDLPDMDIYQQGWIVAGMYALPDKVTLTGETEGRFVKEFSNVAQIINDGPLFLVGVRPALPSIPENPTIEIFLNQSVTGVDLERGQTSSISIKVTSENGFTLSFPLIFESRNGATCILLLSVNILQILPTFEVEPNKITTKVTRGMQHVLKFDVKNTGRGTAHDVQFIVPKSDLLSVLSQGSTDKNIRLETGEVLQPSVLIQIPVDQPLGELSGQFVISAKETSKTIPYTIFVSSDDILNLVVKVEDEFSYFAEGKPLVADATVLLINRNRNIHLTKATSEGNGTVTFMNLNEDRYELTVSAPQHKTYRAVILASPDKPVLTIFLERTAVQYTWTVTPTTVIDTYQVTLEADFEARVPMPVVTVTPTSFDLEEIELGYINTLELNITNHGLIRAENVTFTLPGNHPFLDFSVPAASVDHLDAQTSIIVPVEISRKSRQKRNIVWALYIINIGYSFLCGDWKFRFIPVVLRKPTPGPTPEPTPGPTPGTPRYRPWRRGTGLPFYNFGGYTASTPVLCNDCLGAFLGCFSPPKFPLAGCIPKLASGPPKVESIKDALDWINCAIPIEFNIGKSKGIGNGGGGGGGSRMKFKWSPITCVLDLYEKCLKDDSSGGSSRKKRDVKEEIILSFVGSLKAVHYSVEIASEILGDGLWLDVKDSKWLTEVLKPTVDDLSVGGSFITEAEYQSIISHSGPNGTTLEDVTALVKRVNSTIKSWGEGTLEPEENGQNDIASFSFITDLSKEVQLYDEKARKMGHDSYLDAYNDNNVKVKQIENIEEEAGVCAVVRLRIEQELTLTREGFIAKLEIKNGENSELSDVDVKIYITNKKTGVESTALFSIGSASYKGDIDSEKALEPGKEGSIEWLLIPYSDAAPVEMTLYDVGGTLSYELEERQVTIPLLPAQIKVSPDPRLTVHYFWEKFVISDDPFTDIIEESVPFTLGVAIANTGYGTAYDMKITSAQPQIIENEKGLKVSFKIISSMVGDGPVVPSLTVDLDDIGPNSTKIARWWLTCSLMGQFKNYSATFENKNPLGDPKLSLIESLEIHELIRNVKMTGEGEDEILDFLVNDDKEISVYPDILYSSSDLAMYKVHLGEVPSFKVIKNGQNQTWQIETASNSSGWNYFRLDTNLPSNIQLNILTFEELSAPNWMNTMKPIENIWITARNGDKKSDTLILHLFDTFSFSNQTRSYLLRVCSGNCGSDDTENVTRDSTDQVSITARGTTDSMITASTTEQSVSPGEALRSSLMIVLLPLSLIAFLCF